MNMISTGAFLNEMDASNKQPSTAEKFAAVWEKKNAKAARAGGVSLMALSLAACGSSSDDTSNSSNQTTPVASGDELTNGTDQVTASGTIDAGLVWSPGGDTRTMSLQSEDTVTGSGSADVINITSNGGAVAPTLNGLETINFNVAGATAGTLNLSNSSGYSSIELSSTDGDVGVTGLVGSPTVTAANSADANTNAFAAFKSSAVTGTGTEASIAVDGFLGSNFNVGASASATAAGTGIEVLNIAASGETSSIASVGSGAATVNVDADAKLTISAFTSTGITKLDAGESSATTSLNVADNLSANDMTYIGGAGDDTLIATTGFNGSDSLDGGAGDDTLSIRPATGSADLTVGALNSSSVAVAANIENLDMRSLDNGGGNAIDFTVDYDTVPGVVNTSMRAGDTGTATVFTLNDMTADQASNLTVTFNGTGATVATDITVAAEIKDVSGSDDTVTIDVTASKDDDTTSTNNQILLVEDASPTNGTENLVINVKGSKGIILNTEASTFGTKLTVTGGAADQDIVNTTNLANTTIDMSDVAADVTFTTSGTTQTITTGSGKDEITLDGGSKTVDLGAGNDTLHTGTTAIGNASGNVDSFAGGDGTDVLWLEGNATDTGTVLGVVSGFETLRIDSGVAETLTMSNFTNNTGFTKIIFDENGGNTTTVNNAGSAITDLEVRETAHGDTLVFDRLVDGSADAITVTTRDAASTPAARTVTALTIADEETVTLSSYAATSDFTFTDMTATDMTSLTVTGAGDMVVTNAITGATKLATVDATAATGVVEIHSGNSVVAMTATGNSSSSAKFEFTGGSKADTITGGGGGDVIVGGAGADVISTGAGTDEITGGAGIDTITGGGGADTINTATLAVDRDNITDFKVGAGGDILKDLTVTEAATATTDMFTDTASGALTIHTSDAVVMIGHTNIANFTDAASLTGANLLTALGGTLKAAATNEVVFLAIDDGADTGVYLASAGGAVTVTASEIVLVAVLEGVADCTTLTYDNFST